MTASSRHTAAKSATSPLRSSESGRKPLWFARFRRLAVRYERRVDIFEAFHHLAAALICLGFARRWRCPAPQVTTAAASRRRPAT
jgi:hypothetical protein